MIQVRFVPCKNIMKSLIVFYSLTGKTAEIAKQKSIEESADLIELKDLKKTGLLKAFIFGAYKAIKQKKTELQPIDIDFSKYDKIIFAMPIWASMPAPAFNNIVEMLPFGKDIEMILTSAGGDSKDASTKIEKKLQSKGCKLVKTTDIKTAK